MKILVFGISDGTPEELRSFGYSTSSNFIVSLRRCGIEVVVDEIPFLFTWRGNPRFEMTRDLPNLDILEHLQQIPVNAYDHIIATGLRNISRLPKPAYSILKQKTTGLVCEFNDVSQRTKGNSDVVFVARGVASGIAHEHQVGWGADPVVFRPNQNTSLDILIDHAHYTANGFSTNDKTLEILHALESFVVGDSWKSKFASVCVKRIGNNGKMNIVDFDQPIKVDRFDNTGLPYPQYARELSLSYLFIPTHTESLGLSVLEAAMSGALVVSPVGCIVQERLNTVRHVLVDFSRPVDWKRVVSQIDVAKSREVALANTWDALASRVVAYLKDMVE